MKKIGNEVRDVSINIIKTTDKLVGVSSLLSNETTSAAASLEEISASIQKIASQTNILALNAAVEAARARRSGQGGACCGC